MENKKTLKEWANSHTRTIFWIRFVLWAFAACILPFCFIAFRFELFSKISKISVSGWGIFAILIVVVFIFSILRYLKKGLKGRYNFWIQCINGVLKITLPLLAFFMLINSMKDNLDYFLQALGCVILCETIAVPLNPLPKWAYEAQRDSRMDERKDTVDYLLDKVSKKKEKE